MRKAGIAISAALTATLTAGAVPQPGLGATSRQLTCGAQFTLLFWPTGHGKVTSLGFPAYPLPHAELFAGTRQPGYLEAAGPKGPVAKSSDPCRAAGKAVPASPVAPSGTRAAGRIDCRFAKPPVFVFSTIGTRARFTATVPGTRSGMTVEVRPGGGLATFDPQACRRSAPPR